ncbi:MAG: hypothetical protein AAF554_10645 [Bacteroidota bacterium]
MSESIEILKAKFEKKLKRLKEKSIVANENIQSLLDGVAQEEVKSLFFEKDAIKKKNFSKAKRKLKVAQGSLKAFLKEERSETDVDSIRTRSEKYEDFALANLNLANFCIGQAELAAIAALLASLEAMRLNDTEENYMD